LLEETVGSTGKTFDLTRFRRSVLRALVADKAHFRIPKNQIAFIIRWNWITYATFQLFSRHIKQTQTHP